jgi:DNA-3-methyladenine glycosylase
MGRGLTGSGLTGSGTAGPAQARSGLASPGLAGSGPLLTREFFARPAIEVAPDLLGCVLAHETADGLVAVVIAEVEAYAGASDPASHAFRGKTVRNAVMFGPPGHAYVYFTYGMHFCVNLVCRGAGDASAVLLRAGRVSNGTELAMARRHGGRTAAAGSKRATGSTPAAGITAAADSTAAKGTSYRAVREIDLARGPARLCQALGIDRAQDGADICDPDSPLRVHAPAGQDARAAPEVSRGPRVGVSRAAEVAWRFWITGEPAVSAYRPGIPRRARAKPGSGQSAGDGTMPR